MLYKQIYLLSKFSAFLLFCMQGKLLASESDSGSESGLYLSFNAVPPVVHDADSLSGMTLEQMELSKDHTGGTINTTPMSKDQIFQDAVLQKLEEVQVDFNIQFIAMRRMFNRVGVKLDNINDKLGSMSERIAILEKKKVNFASAAKENNK